MQYPVQQNVGLDLGSWSFKLCRGSSVTHTVSVTNNSGEPSFINAVQYSSTNSATICGLQALRHWRKRHQLTIVGSSHFALNGFFSDTISSCRFVSTQVSNFEHNNHDCALTDCHNFLNFTQIVLQDVLQKTISPSSKSISLLVSLPLSLLPFQEHFRKAFLDNSAIASVKIVLWSQCIASSFLLTQKERDCVAAFIDVGFSLSKVCIAQIQNNEVYLHHEEPFDSEILLGGRDVEQVIVNYFLSQLKSHTPRDEISILQSVQENITIISRTASGNLNFGTVQIGDDDLELIIPMSYLDSLLNDFKSKFTSFIANFKDFPIDFVVVTGGTSHFFFIEDIIEHVFGKKIHRVLNSISDISRGACSLLFPDAQPKFHYCKLQKVVQANRLPNPSIPLHNQSSPRETIRNNNRRSDFHETEIEKLTKEYKHAYEKIKLLTAQKEKLDAEYKNLSSGIKDLNNSHLAELSKLQQEIAGYTDQVTTTEFQLSQLQEKYNQQVKRQESLVEQLRNASDSLREKDEQINALKNDINCLRNNVQKEFQDEVSKLKAVNTLLSHDLEETQKQLFTSQCDITKLRDQLKRTQSSFANDSTPTDVSHKIQHDFNQQIHSSSNNLEEVHLKPTTNQQCKSIFEERERYHYRERLRLILKLGIVSRSNTVYRYQIEEFKSTNEELKKHSALLHDKLTEFSKLRTSESEARVQKLEHDIHVSNQYSSDLTNSPSDSCVGNSELVRIKDSLDVVQQENEQLITKLVQLTTLNVQLAEERQQLSESIKLLHDEERSLKMKVSHLEQCVSVLQDRNSKLENDLVVARDSQKQISFLESRVSSLNQQVVELNITIKQKEDELASVRMKESSPSTSSRLLHTSPRISTPSVTVSDLKTNYHSLVSHFGDLPLLTRLGTLLDGGLCVNSMMLQDLSTVFRQVQYAKNSHVFTSVLNALRSNVMDVSRTLVDDLIREPTTRRSYVISEFICSYFYSFKRLHFALQSLLNHVEISLLKNLTNDIIVSFCSDFLLLSSNSLSVMSTVSDLVKSLNSNSEEKRALDHVYHFIEQYLRRPCGVIHYVFDLFRFSPDIQPYQIAFEVVPCRSLVIQNLQFDNHSFNSLRGSFPCYTPRSSLNVNITYTYLRGNPVKQEFYIPMSWMQRENSYEYPKQFSTCLSSLSFHPVTFEVKFIFKIRHPLSVTRVSSNLNSLCKFLPD
ncbi:hypothetical protein RCL1_005345 [Eukaryota sp. TZLM3-RCL]